MEAATTLELPDIPTVTSAWSHQREAYWWAMDHKMDSVMLAMDMGTGKSLVTIGLLEGWETDLALILCPTNVVGVWPREFERHARRDWRIIAPPRTLTIPKRVQYIHREMARVRRGQPVALVVNYESFWRGQMLNYLLDRRWGAVVCDESHRIKAPGGKASLTAMRMGRIAKRRVCATGTPMPHSPLDVYAQYRFLDPSVFGTSYNRFKNRYAITQQIGERGKGGFEKVIGYQNQGEFSGKFGSIAFVCKADEVLDLPEYTHTERTFELGVRSRRAYSTLESDFILGVENGTVTTGNALTKLLRLQQVTSGFVRDDDGTDHEVGDEKIKALADVMDDIPPGEPMVIFCRFHHDLDRIAVLCEQRDLQWGEISGRVKQGHPSHALNNYAQMRADIDVAIVQEQAGGVGIDLTAAAYCIFYSLTFSLGDYDQALKRVHRPGQDRHTHYIHLVAEDTKDQVVYEALATRRAVVEAVIESARR